MESFLAPQTITHAAHVKVDRETGVVRVLRFAAAHDSGMILNRIGADGQVLGGVVMGIGQALSEGSMHDEDGRQRNPHLLDYKLVTSADVPPIDIRWVEIDTPNAGPKGAKGVGEPPCVPTAAAVANGIAARARPPPRQAADDARAGLGGGERDRGMSGATYLAAGSLDEALDALAAGARPVAGGTDLVVGQRSGAKPMPGAIVAIHGLGELRALDTSGGLRAGALVSHATLAADPVVAERYTALADASAIVGSHATRATGTIGGNVMNASPAMDTGGPLLCLGGVVTLVAAGGEARDVPLDELWTGPGRTTAEPGELLTAVSLPPVAPGTGSAYVRLEYRRQMEIAVVGATAVVRLEGDVDHRRARRDHRARPDDPARPGGRGRAGRAAPATTPRPRPPAPRPPSPPRRSPTTAARSSTAARWPR